MNLIIGGIAQGKREFAKAMYELTDSDLINGDDVDYNENIKCRCIYNFQKIVKKITLDGGNPLEYAERFLSKNPDAVIILNEVGSGIIPLEKSDRVWRENVGRTGTYFANNAESVTRIICGIAVKIK